MALKHNLLTSAAAWPVSFGIVAGALSLAAAAAYAPCRVRCGPTRPAAANATGEALNPVAAKRPAAAAISENPPAVIRIAASCSPCNPCAAAACSPCNPCAAAGCSPCNPCAAEAAMDETGCVAPSLQEAAACNPCAAKAPCNPCNPCAAQNPCNPCAASNPCNPCAAANPCNPCAAAAEEDVEVPDDEMQALYDCLKPLMLEAYGPGNHAASGEWGDWQRFSTRAYVSGTHGGRFVQNHANDVAAEDYGKYEDVVEMPSGSILAKPSFTVGSGGEAALGPLFLMEKMTRGWNADTADWRYAMVNADGSTFGVTGGQNSDGMTFCHECHAAGQDSDYMLFLPEAFRRQ